MLKKQLPPLLSERLNRRVIRGLKTQNQMAHQKALENIKIELCQHIRRLATKEGLNGKQLAIHLETSESRVSKIVAQRTADLTLDALFRYLITLEPNTRLLVATH